MKRLEIAVIVVMIVMLFVGGCALGRRTAPSSTQPAVSLPTLMPTPAIIVPTPPAGPVTSNGNGNTYNYSITINETTTNVCASVFGCW